MTPREVGQARHAAPTFISPLPFTGEGVGERAESRETAQHFPSP